MVFSFPNHNGLPKNTLSNFVPQERYSLFKRVHNKWVRVRFQSHTMEMAMKCWAKLVIDNPKEFSIRKCALDVPLVQANRHNNKLFV